MNIITEKQLLTDKIVEAIQDTKGEDIKILDLTKIENSVAEYFVICSGNSNTFRGPEFKALNMGCSASGF